MGYYISHKFEWNSVMRRKVHLFFNGDITMLMVVVIISNNMCVTFELIGKLYFLKSVFCDPISLIRIGLSSDSLNRFLAIRNIFYRCSLLNIFINPSMMFGSELVCYQSELQLQFDYKLHFLYHNNGPKQTLVVVQDRRQRANFVMVLAIDTSPLPLLTLWSISHPLN